MLPSSKIDRKAVNKVKFNTNQSDFAFWQKQPYEMRLATLEEIRQEYIRWAYDSKPRFQRVYRVVKQASI